MSDSPGTAGSGRGGDAAEETFAAQVLRYLVGEATPQDLSELRDALSRLPERRTVFVRLCRLHGELTELLAPARVRARGTPPPAGSTGPGEESPSRESPGAPESGAGPEPPPEDDTAFHPRNEEEDTRH